MRCGLSHANKWQNRQSQSWFRPPDTALHRLVLQLEPCDTSPWLFSVNSALSRPSILPCCLMSQQSLTSQLPPSPAFTICTIDTCFFFPRFSLGWMKEGNSCLFYKKQKPHLPTVPGTSQKLSQKERWANVLFPLLDLVLMVEHILDADRPLSFPQWFVFLLLIQQPSAMKIALWQDGVHCVLFDGCRVTLSFSCYHQKRTGGL